MSLQVEEMFGQKAKCKCTEKRKRSKLLIALTNFFFQKVLFVQCGFSKFVFADN